VADYSKLIDAETWAFIERTNSWYPPETIDYPIAEQRRTYDSMCREFFAGYPDNVTAETTDIATPTHAIPIRIYRSASPDASAVVLYCHGGGFILGGLDSHDDFCAELCVRTGYDLISVDYRLAPEHLHPAAFEDVRAAFEWVATTYARPILLAGDSAHANNPIGGMGMNGGIHDGINLAEKLAAVIHGEGPNELLDLYSRQRRHAAVKYVQAQTISNKRLMEERDPAVRQAYFDELRKTAENLDSARAYMRRAALFDSLRDAAAVT